MTKEEFITLRKGLGLNQKALAELLKTKQPAIGLMETGTRPISPYTGYKLRLAALGGERKNLSRKQLLDIIQDL